MYDLKKKTMIIPELQWLLVKPDTSHLKLKTGGSLLKSPWIKILFNQNTLMYKIFITQFITGMVNLKEDKFPNIFLENKGGHHYVHICTDLQ